jgi:hypothetical protein
MNRRIEFTLNLDNPVENAIYEALAVALRRRRAGELIRQALTAYLFDSAPTPARPHAKLKPVTRQLVEAKPNEGQIDAPTTEQIIDRSAAMFGF